MSIQAPDPGGHPRPPAAPGQGTTSRAGLRGEPVRLSEQPAAGSTEGGTAEQRLPYPPVAGNAARFAQGVVATARQVDGVQLDYSVASLEEVDRILGTYHDDGLDAAQVAGTVFAFGCYLGEVLVRHAGGTWQDLDPRAGQQLGAAIGVRMPDGSVADPVGQAFRRVEDGPGNSLPWFYTGLAG